MIKKVLYESEMPQGSHSWRLWRNLGVGGSEIASLVGMSPYKLSSQLFDEKLGYRTDEVGEAGLAAMARGTQYENEAREWYSSMVEARTEPVCLIHDEHEFARASLDGLTFGGGNVVEIKVPVSFDKHKKQVGKGLIPQYRWPQCQWNMGIAYSHWNTSKCHYVSYIPEAPELSVIIEIGLNYKFFDLLVQRAATFIESVNFGVFPGDIFFDSLDNSEVSELLCGENYVMGGLEYRRKEWIKQWNIPQSQKVIYNGLGRLK